jgi:hypothetical protein
MASNSVSNVDQQPIGYLYAKSEGKNQVAYKLIETLYLRKAVSIGRHGSNDLTVFDRDISSYHLKIYTISYGDPDVEPLIYATDLSRNGTLHNGVLIGKHQSVLLSDNDELALNAHIKIVFKEKKASKPLTVGKFRRTAPKLASFLPEELEDIEKFDAKYGLTDRKLGAGAVGKVYLAESRQTRRQVACKIICVKKIFNVIDESIKQVREDAQDRSADGRAEILEAQEKRNEEYIRARFREIRTEIGVLRKVNHPNVIQLFDSHKSQNAIWLFQELVTGGDLFSYQARHGNYLDTITTSLFAFQLLKGLAYLHSKKVVHRDIKPENVLVATHGKYARIVISDFGSAYWAPISKDSLTNGRMTGVYGTTAFMAP